MFAESVLWPREPSTVAEVVVDEATVADLRLDQVIAAVVGSPDEFGLAALLRRPVRDRDTVRYRQEVFADLAVDEIRAVFDDFAAGLRRVRRRSDGAARLQHPRQRQRWHLDAAADYLAALTTTAAALPSLPLTSRALRQWRTAVLDAVAGPAVTELAEQVRTVREALAAVRYSVRVLDTGTLAVGPDDDTSDYTATITELLARFGAGPPPPPPPTQPEWPDMNQMEEQILDRVAALAPQAFGQLAAFADRSPRFVDPAVASFDREIHFYLRYLDFAATLTEPLSLPRILDAPGDIGAEDAFDIALAAKPGRTGPLVCNDFELADPERVLVVTGPNQGGKTTFARMVGQLCYLAALGCPVPARSAHLALPDRLTTHFERAEQAGDADGRLLAELGRVRETLDNATADSVLILNESFSSTSTLDGVRIGGQVLDRIIAAGSVAVWVTFFDELAAARPETVSMVAATDPADPARRTFRIVRRAADGQAHAVVLAQRYGLTYGLVTARMTACE
ncbi:DNA mismatch repair protein MutS [Nocardia sp. NPDC059177]|uniref:MutS-related protein n=1 Tax=Nocardia sp. NPDC059177 TaxID=3346759 RepID=UPI00368BA031